MPIIIFNYKIIRILYSPDRNLNSGEKFITDYFNNIDKIAFQDTISIIKNLDIVISVDTSIAHISATLNKETWILLSFVPDFRWGLKNTKTFWYKNVKLFRQSKIMTKRVRPVETKIRPALI